MMFGIWGLGNSERKRHSVRVGFIIDTSLLVTWGKRLIVGASSRQDKCCTQLRKRHLRKLRSSQFRDCPELVQHQVNISRKFRSNSRVVNSRSVERPNVFGIDICSYGNVFDGFCLDDEQWSLLQRNTVGWLAEIASSIIAIANLGWPFHWGFYEYSGKPTS